jgi:hypothetical protein
MLLIYVYSFFKGLVPEIGTVCDDFTALPYDLRYSVSEIFSSSVARVLTHEIGHR